MNRARRRLARARRERRKRAARLLTIPRVRALTHRLAAALSGVYDVAHDVVTRARFDADGSVVVDVDVTSRARAFPNVDEIRATVERELLDHLRRR